MDSILRAEREPVYIGLMSHMTKLANDVSARDSRNERQNVLINWAGI